MKTWASGQKLHGGKYTVEKKLGRGGFGITYLAKNANGQYVAIKTLNDRVQRKPDFDRFQQDFLNEVLRLAECFHPHIVCFDEVFQEGRLWCMVMEYIPGESLARRVLNQGVLPEAEALEYTQQIGEALTVIHSNGLLHRDVKPQNIMLRADGSGAVLIDFGIAREFTPNLAQMHTTFTTNNFAPIEQYDKRARRGAYTDVYALASTLYVCLTGEVPVPAPVRAAGVPLEEPKKLNPRISDRVNEAILQGMAFQPTERPQSVQRWLQLLRVENQVLVTPGVQGQRYPTGNATQRQVTATMPSRNSRIDNPQPQQKTLLWIGLATVFLCFTVVGYLLTAISASAWVWAAFVAVVVVEAVAVAEAKAIAVVGAVAIAIGLAFLVAQWVAIPVAGGVSLAMVVVTNQLLKTCSRFQTFLIVAVSSGVGLGLGCLLNWMIKLI